MKKANTTDSIYNYCLSDIKMDYILGTLTNC